MNLENIISKYLLNKTDKVELEQLQSWQNEAKDNLRALEDMQKIFSLDMSEYKSYDQESAWSKIESKIESKIDQKPEFEQGKVVQMKKWIMTAIAALAFLAASLFIWKSYQEPQQQLFYASNINKEAHLPDQSVVTLDANSTLEVLSDNFKSNRSLALTGRAYFDVESDILHPFTVKLNQGFVTVLGTEFSLSTLYNIDEVYVTEGKVRYSINDRNIELRAGDYIKVINGDIVKLQVNGENILSWKLKKLVLEDEPILSALKKMSNHYQTSIVMADGLNVADCRITTTIELESLEEALEELKILTSLEYAISPEKVVITQIKC